MQEKTVSNKSEKVFKKALKRLRKSQACTLAVEEISELISEIMIKSRGEYDNRDDLCEEIADVEIMLNLVIGTFGISRKDIKKQKKRHEKSFSKHMEKFSERKDLEEITWELANLQKAICKGARKRKNKDDLVDAIVAVDLSMDYLEEKHIISYKEMTEWYDKKLLRMKKRVRKNCIV